MKYHHTKMHLKVTIPALTCVVISTAAAVLLVCATNQMKPDGQLDQIDRDVKTTSSTTNRGVLKNSTHQTGISQRQLRPEIRIQNGTIQTNNTGDHQAQASILRPLIIKHLLSGGKKKPAESAPTESEEEEEVTKTIMVPVNPEDAEFKSGDKHSEAAAESSAEPNDQMIQYISGHQMKLSRGSDVNKGTDNQKRAKQPSMAVVDMSTTQPNAEASLRLTSTEIGGLLNDREAPEFYRERELNGDGVLVGEERPSSVSALHNSFSSSPSRLGMAASGHFGSQFMGGAGGGFGESMPYGNNLGFDSSEAALYRHRLNQAASEEAYGGGGGFNHRFGQQAFGGAGEGELGFGQGTGGLMQAPNEYNEVNSMGATGGYMSDTHSQSYGGGGGEYSGLLRAGSEGLYGGGGAGLGHGMGGAPSGFMGHGGSLETAAAGGYGPMGAGDFGSSGEMMGHANAFSAAGRLQAHASYNPYMQSAGEADYSNRFGQHQAAGFSQMGDFGDQRGFASQNNHQLLRSATSGNPHSSSMANSRGLLPLTPTVPLPEDLPSPVTQPSVLSSNQREQISQQPADLAQLVRQQQNLEQQQRFTPRTRPSSGQQQQQIHEALEEDPTDTTSSDDEQSTGHQQQAQQNYETITSNSDSDETGTTTSVRSTRPQMSAFNGGELGPSLVLNVPPPGDQAAAAPVAQMVEFSRVGSAGYLGPRSSSLAKKSGPRFSHHNQEMADGGGGDGDEDSASEPIDNPAHAGKYIID